MTDRPDVAVRLLPLKLCLRHNLVLRLVSFRVSGMYSFFLRLPAFAFQAPALHFSTEARVSERRLERVKGIEPSSSAWKAVALPLSYTRLFDFLLSSSLFDGPASPFGLAAAAFAASPSGLAEPKPRSAAKAGGGGWTRTNEALSSGFTVRPLCHSGHSPGIFSNQINGLFFVRTERPNAETSPEKLVADRGLWGDWDRVSIEDYRGKPKNSARRHLVKKG